MQSDRPKLHKPEIHVEESRTVDPVQLLEIQLAAIRHLSGMTYRPAQIRAWCEMVEDEHRSGYVLQFRTWLARIHGRTAGFGRIDDDGFIGSLYVKPRDAGQGVGAALVEAMVGMARERQRDEVSVNASMNSVAFYRRCGFTDIDDIVFFDHPLGVQLAAARMVKSTRQRLLPNRTLPQRASA